MYTSMYCATVGGVRVHAMHVMSVEQGHIYGCPMYIEKCQDILQCCLCLTVGTPAGRDSDDRIAAQGS